MLKKLVIWGGAGAIILLATLFVVISMQPGEFQVTRSASFVAPPDKVFAEVNDFHKWEKWSPWQKLDPEMKESFSGPPSGVGSAYSWAGNDEVGEGRMVIMESDPNSRVKIDLDFIRPFESKNITEFQFRPDESGTSVTWTMSGHKNFISKAACMVMDMDKMVGGDFEKGLSKLKSVVESHVDVN